MDKIIVTGVNGFVGKHLAHELTAQNYEVVGVGTDDALVPELSELVSKYYQCDLTDIEQVRKISLNGVKGIINLAGLAAVGPSFDNPDLYMRVNTGVLDTLCTIAIEQDAKDINILAISSGAVYSSQQEMPLSELTSKTDKDSSPYAASKLAMEELAQEYRAKGINCTVARPFNHIGPGQMPGFILPDLYKKVAEAKDGETLLVGNLTTKRDYTDVRDVARAYVSLVTGIAPAEAIYNVCTGRSLSGEEILALLTDELGRTVSIQVDEKLFRPSDAPDLYGDNTLLSLEKSWKPEIDIRQTIADFVASQPA